MNTHNKQAGNPIGIFDSGIGGLTVANAISQLLPAEKLVYFGDTAHLPYGDKSADSINYYAVRISQFLLKQKCKMIVIACNTASSLAYKTVKDFVKEQSLVVNVIDPVVDTVVKQKKYKKIGVIGTKGTIRSDVYSTKIKSLRPAAEVVSVATPLLAPMIEEGFFNNKISRTIIHSYLSRPRLKNIDSLILACTHYPLIKPEIGEYYEKSTGIIDSASAVALYVKKLLGKNHLLNKTPGKKTQRFFVSDYTQAFEQSTRYFFRNKIKLEEADIWK